MLQRQLRCLCQQTPEARTWKAQKLPSQQWQVACSETNRNVRRRVRCCILATTAYHSAIPSSDVEVITAGQSTALAGVRAFLFYSWTLLLSLPLFAVMLVQAPFTLLLDKVRWGICMIEADEHPEEVKTSCSLGQD